MMMRGDEVLVRGGRGATAQYERPRRLSADRSAAHLAGDVLGGGGRHGPAHGARGVPGPRGRRGHERHGAREPELQRGDGCGGTVVQGADGPWLWQVLAGAPRGAWADSVAHHHGRGQEPPMVRAWVDGAARVRVGEEGAVTGGLEG
jgi:hypothetical protein